MKSNSIQKAKLNIISTLISQLVVTVCGIAIPRVLIGAFGSTTYGVTTSIAQFLAYIALLDGGIGRVARAELYAPLAQQDNREISRIYHAMRRFYWGVGVIFCIYTAALSLTYYDLARLDGVGRKYVFLLIWIISATTLAKYLFGISNQTLLNADQKQYIGNTIVVVTTFLNAVLVILLVHFDCGILTVKLVSSLVYLMQPVVYALYVRKNYLLQKVGKAYSKLQQKWTGIGQHIAYFLHTNTDIVLLTLFANIRLVAVYSVYRMVISSIRKIAASFTGGMEAAFGELYAKQELNALRSSYRTYKWMLSAVAIILFGTTLALIIPFVRIYTAGITDVNYIQPLFAVLMLFAEEIDCVIHPCCSLPVAANQLKETRWGSYGEALINVGVSLLLVHRNPMVGVAIGTLTAALFKSFFYMRYSAKHILQISIWEPLKSFLFTNLTLGAIGAAGWLLISRFAVENLFVWCLWGGGVFVFAAVVTVLVSRLLYPAELSRILSSLKR